MASADLLKAVIDPGVIVSGLISGIGAPQGIIEAWRAGSFEFIVSDALLRELEDVLKRPKFRRYFSLEQAARFLEELRAGANIENEGYILAASLDPKDDYLLSLARASKADYLVSGDKRHLLALELRDYPPAVSPRDFLTILEEIRNNPS